MQDFYIIGIRFNIHIWVIKKLRVKNFPKCNIECEEWVWNN